MGESGHPSTRIRVRKWIQKLGSKEQLAFSGQDELKMLLDLYDHDPSHPIQYYFDDRFKGRLPVSDLSLCHTATENLDRNRTSENYPTDEGLLRTADGGFINASTIEGKDRTYIATQHPLPSTVLDFWKMVLAEKPAAIIMLNKHDYDQEVRKPGEPDLVQYWPGTSKAGPFIDSILLEDKDTGGTVKVSVLPEPPTHDIEELDKTTQNHSPTLPPYPSPKNPTNSTIPAIGTLPTPPAITDAASPLTVTALPVISTPVPSSENNTHQIALLDSTPAPSPTTALQPMTTNYVAPRGTKTFAKTETTSNGNWQEKPATNLHQTSPITNTDVAPPVVAVTDTSANSETTKNGKEEQRTRSSNAELHGTHGHQEYKLNSNIEYSRLLVEYQGQQHQLWHIRCGGWKDQDAPDLDLFMDLWRLVQEKLKAHKVNSGEKHKIVIHCTGGVGRTGTFIAVDIAGQELKEKQKDGKWDEFSIEKVISFLRKKRMNMVGSVSQYIFCHRAALNLFGLGGTEIEDKMPTPALEDGPPVIGVLT